MADRKHIDCTNEKCMDGEIVEPPGSWYGSPVVIGDCEECARLFREEQADDVLALIDGNASAGEPNTAPDRLTEPAQPALFYIQDTRQVVGNCPVWWGPNGGGYVTRLDEAGRYTEQEAVSQNRTRETDIPWPCAEIDALARKTVDCQHMRPRAERLAELSMLHGQAVQP